MESTLPFDMSQWFIISMYVGTRNALNILFEFFDYVFQDIDIHG